MSEEKKADVASPADLGLPRKSRAEQYAFPVQHEKERLLAETPPADPAVPEEAPTVESPVGAPASGGPHPMIVSPEEGMFEVSQAEVIEQCNVLLRLKYTGMVLYANYGDRLLAHWRDAVYQHFNEHLEDERKGAYKLTMKITALGGSPVPKTGPMADVETFHQMLMELMTAEKKLIKEARKLADMAGENTGLRIFAEELILLDNHHLDDLRRMLLCEA